MRKCKICGKLHNNKYCCSNKCKYAYFKKYKIGVFFESNFQKEMSRRGSSKAGKIGGKMTQELHPTQFSEMGKRCHKLHPNHARDWGRKVGSENMKKVHKLYPEESKEWCGKGGQKSAKILREKKGYYWKGNSFASKGECETGMCIHYQIERLKEGVNYQFNVDNKSFDFFVKNCFIEYHPTLSFFNPDETDESYYNARRKILNKNGYKDYPLIVIK